MILSEKIMLLRKQNGWSQEELAEKLGISRQSVSKWELGAAIPDLDKIIKLSSLFSVSTDYLLRDDIEGIDFNGKEEGEETGIRTVSVEEAHTYMKLAQDISGRMALAVSMLILSPVCLMLLGGVADCYGTISENAAGGIGLVILLLMVAVGVGLLVPCGMQLEKYKYLEEDEIALAYGVEGIVEKRRSEKEKSHRQMITVGVMLCILAVVPLLVAMGFEGSDFALIVCVNLLLAVVAAAVNIFIRTGMVYGSYEKLLQIGDYSVERKKTSRKAEGIAGIYWCAVTAIYLGISFYSADWGRTWIVWPVAGVLFGAIMCFVRMSHRD